MGVVLGPGQVHWSCGQKFSYRAIPQSGGEKLYCNTTTTLSCLNTKNASTERPLIIKTSKERIRPYTCKPQCRNTRDMKRPRQYNISIGQQPYSNRHEGQ
jgi:hypothetical protein